MASLSSRPKSKMRAPRRGLNGADLDFPTRWGILEQAFIAIHSKNASALSFEELYRHAYKIVLAKQGADLYNSVAKFEEVWLATQVRSSIVTVLSAQLLLQNGNGTGLATIEERKLAGSVFLRSLKQAWEDHQVCMSMLTDVLMYMDRVYCTDRRVPSIYAKAMGLFRDQILRAPAGANQPSLIEILTRVILDQIHMVRCGEQIDSHLIKSNVYMLEGLYQSDQEVEDEKLYLQSFESLFLETSARFFKEEAETYMKDVDAGLYCRHAQSRIHEETDRCRSTLSESTAPKIQQVVEDELIRHRMKGLIEMDTGVKYMVDNEKLAELGLMFDLEARVDPRKPELTAAMQKIIHDIGASINDAAMTASLAPVAPSNPVEDQGGDDKGKAGQARQTNQQTVAALKWVADMLALKAQMDKLWRLSFDSDQLMSTALSRSMSGVINAFSRSSEYISLFIDENMKKGIKDKTEAEIDQTLEEAITTVRYLQDKDMFETYYKKHLGKRLLLKKSQSLDVEKQMILRMKLELGNSFTMKLEAMFKDMALSEELSSGYRDHVSKLGSIDPKRIDLSINVLTAMTWPLESFRGGQENDTSSSVVFPSLLARVKTGFERYYADKYSGRKLTWLTNMGEADIKATFPKSSKSDRARTYDISCSTFAMLILLLFNDLPPGEHLSLEEMLAQTNIPESDLKRNLQALAVAPKTRFLIKEPMSREINAGDRFRFNESFTSKFIRIKVGVVSAGNKVEGERDRKETEKKATNSRGFVIDAAIVRIMKQRKLLAHAQLLTETITQLTTQFKPDVNMIKKKIESLIEREYLERVDDAPVPSYRYLA